MKDQKKKNMRIVNAYDIFFTLNVILNANLK